MPELQRPRPDTSHAGVWRLAGPIILSNISVPLVGAVDTAVMGHLDGPHFLAAIALGALVFSFLYWGFGFLRMGTTGFVARDFGRNDTRGVHDTLTRALFLSLVFGCAVVLLQRPLNQLAFSLLEAGPEVESLASQYVLIRIWSAPATLMVYALTGVLIGLHDTRSALYLQLALNLTNVALDLLFVPVLGFGIAGAAAASLIAEYAAAGFGLFLLRRLIGAYPVQRTRLLDPAALLVLMRANADIFVRTLCLVFSFAWFTAMGARLGEAVLAANAVLMNFQNLTSHGLDGFAHAAEALGGSAYGARDRDRFRLAVRRTSAWAIATSIATGLVFFVFGDALIALFSDLPGVRADAAAYLPWLAVSPLISVWSFQLDGIFIGTSRTAEMRNAMLASTLGYLVVVQWTMTAFGNHGLWLGLMVFMVLRAATLMAYYPRILRSMDEGGR